MKNKFLKTILYIILFASFIGVFFVMSIVDLTNKSDIHEVSVDAAAQILVVEKSINGIIPTGKEYYYVGINEEKGELYTIHAGKNWLDKNFDSEGMAKGGSISVKGLAKRAGDYKTENEISARITRISTESGYTSVFESDKAIEPDYVFDAIMKLIAGILILATGIILFVFRNRTEEFPSWTGKAIAVLFIVTLVFALWTIL